jgi:flagellar biosynthetic protein FliQ
MSEVDALDLLQQALWVTIIISAPVVLSAMVVGLVVAVVQALTQVQEMTLTFVPKMIVGFLVMAISAPYVGNVLKAFMETLYGHISNGFG